MPTSPERPSGPEIEQPGVTPPEVGPISVEQPYSETTPWKELDWAGKQRRRREVLERGENKENTGTPAHTETAPDTVAPPPPAESSDAKEADQQKELPKTREEVLEYFLSDYKKGNVEGGSKINKELVDRLDGAVASLKALNPSERDATSGLIIAREIINNRAESFKNGPPVLDLRNAADARIDDYIIRNLDAAENGESDLSAEELAMFREYYNARRKILKTADDVAGLDEVQERIKAFEKKISADTVNLSTEKPAEPGDTDIAAAGKTRGFTGKIVSAPPVEGLKESKPSETVSEPIAVEVPSAPKPGTEIVPVGPKESTEDGKPTIETVRVQTNEADWHTIDVESRPVEPHKPGNTATPEPSKLTYEKPAEPSAKVPEAPTAAPEEVKSRPMIEDAEVPEGINLVSKKEDFAHLEILRMAEGEFQKYLQDRKIDRDSFIKERAEKAFQKIWDEAKVTCRNKLSIREQENVYSHRLLSGEEIDGLLVAGWNAKEILSVKRPIFSFSSKIKSKISGGKAIPDEKFDEEIVKIIEQEKAEIRAEAQREAESRYEEIHKKAVDQYVANAEKQRQLQEEQKLRLEEKQQKEEAVKKEREEKIKLKEAEKQAKIEEAKNLPFEKKAELVNNLRKKWSKAEKIFDILKTGKGKIKTEDGRILEVGKDNEEIEKLRNGYSTEVVEIANQLSGVDLIKWAKDKAGYSSKEEPKNLAKQEAFRKLLTKRIKIIYQGNKLKLEKLSGKKFKIRRKTKKGEENFNFAINTESLSGETNVATTFEMPSEIQPETEPEQPVAQEQEIAPEEVVKPETLAPVPEEAINPEVAQQKPALNFEPPLLKKKGREAAKRRERGKSKREKNKKRRSR